MRTSTRHQWWVAVVAGMASYIDAASIVSSGTAVTVYQKAFHLTGVEVGALSGGLTFAIAVGALLGGRLGDRFGRRRVFVVTMALVVIGGVLLVTTTVFPSLMIGTVLVGAGTGADLPVSLSTIAEAADDRDRGRLLGFSQVLWFVGILAATTAGTLFGDLGRLGGQLIWGHIVVVAAIVLLLRFTVPESDLWQQARAERVAGSSTVRAERASLAQLLSRPYAIPFFGLIVFYTLVNLSANTGGQFSTYLLVNVAHVQVSTAASIGLISTPVGIIGAIVYLTLIDTRARFPLFLVGGAAFVASTLVIVVAGFTLASYLVSAVLNIIGASFAFEALMKYWAQQAFPTLLRTTAQGAVIAVARLAAAALAVVTPLVVAHGAAALYGLLTVLNLVGVGVAFLVFRRRDQHNEFAVEREADPIFSGGR